MFLLHRTCPSVLTPWIYFEQIAHLIQLAFANFIKRLVLKPSLIYSGVEFEDKLNKSCSPILPHCTIVDDYMQLVKRNFALLESTAMGLEGSQGPQVDRI